jgi:TonB family protein
MEPRLENVAPLVPSTPPVHNREEGGARFSAMIPAATIPAETEAQLPHSDPPVSRQQGRVAAASSAASGSFAVLASLWGDTSKFYPFRRQIALPIFVGAGVLLLAASFFWRSGRDTGHVVMHPVDASVEGGGNVAGANVAPRAAVSVNGPKAAAAGGARVAAVGEPSAPVTGTQRDSSAPRPMGQGVSRPVDKPTPSKRSAQVPFTSPLRSSSSVAAPTMAKDAAEVTDSSDGAEDLNSVPLSNRPVDVSSGVMAANLLSAPKPSYPKLASLTRMQGNVVMQAVISKNGTVEELHVIKGHRLLRGAAKNAVRNWRYRPYKIDGVPVEVATTVSVDFSLDH